MLNKKPEVLIPNINFPSDNVSDAEKASPEFGLKAGQAIMYQWFNLEGGNCLYYSRRSEFRKRRLYAASNQPVGKYKSIIGADGDVSYLNLDFTPLSIMEKFVNIVANGMGDREMTIKATSQDIMSAEKKSRKQEEIEADMVSKDFLMNAKDQFGVDAFNTNPEDLPEDDEELSLYMNLRYKPAIEIAEEVAINTVFTENEYDDIEARTDKDLTVCGLGVAKHEFLPGNGITPSYVDSEQFIHSPTKDPFFKDCFYFGEVKSIHITELYKIKPDITEAEIKEIKAFSGAWNGYYTAINQSYGFFQKEMVSVLYFDYKATKHYKFKRKKTKTGGERVIARESDFANSENNPLFEVSSIPKEVWYEGILILGTNKLLKWELAANMVRPKSSSQHVIPRFIACAPDMNDGMINSITGRMIPFQDQIQITHLKAQQVISKMVPDGVWIDLDAINGIDLGNGNAYGPTEALRMYFETGSGFMRSLTADNELSNSRTPIIENNKQAPNGKLGALIQNYTHNLNMLRDCTGLNEARDASTPDPNSLVGLQKLAALNSNTATRHILRGKMYLKKRMAQAVSLRISDVLQHSDMAEEFSMKVGKYNLQVLREISTLNLYDFGISLELSPDEEEKQMLEANIQMALSKQEIELDDAIDIRLVKNIKQANELLKIKKRRRQKAKEQREDVQLQQQALIQQDAQKVAAETMMAKVQAEAQAKIMVEQAKADGLIRVEEATAQLKSQLMDKEFNLQMQLKGVEVEAQATKINAQEDRKDEREKQRGTIQSELIDQRHKGLPPKNFESNNDNLADLDFSDISPRV